MEFMNEAYRIVGIGTLEFLEGNFNSKNLEMDPGHQFGLDEVISFLKFCLQTNAFFSLKV